MPPHVPVAGCGKWIAGAGAAERRSPYYSNKTIRFSIELATFHWLLTNSLYDSEA
jgi:hypothetical protein